MKGDEDLEAGAPRQSGSGGGGGLMAAASSKRREVVSQVCTPVPASRIIIAHSVGPQQTFATAVLMFGFIDVGSCTNACASRGRQSAESLLTCWGTMCCALVKLKI